MISMINTSRSVSSRTQQMRKTIPVFLVMCFLLVAEGKRAFGDPPDLCLPVSMKTDILGDYLDQSGPLGEFEGETDDLAFAVAISGGSFRAANFAVGVLIALEQLNYNLLQEVDYISSVSGGGWAAAVYISTLIDHINNEGVNSKKPYRLADYFQSPRPKKKGYSKSNYPKTLLRAGFKGKTITGNLKSLICKTGLMGNDIASADYFEQIYDNGVLSYKRRKRISENPESFRFKDIFYHKKLTGDPSNKMNRVPFWIMNATIVETGELIPLSPNVLKQYNVTGCMHRQEPYTLNESKDNFPVAAGLAGSAAFPFIISPLTLECDYEGYDKIHLIDGGLSDNIGGYTAITLLMQDKRPRKLLLVVDAFNSFDIPFRQVVHAGNKRKIIELCESLGIDVICLDFEILEGEEIYSKLLAARTFYFDVSRSQQKVLLNAGKIVVEKKLDDITATLPRKLAEKFKDNEGSPQSPAYSTKEISGSPDEMKKIGG